MIKTIKKLFNYFGYQISRVNPPQKDFMYDGIKYEADPCSVGKTMEGEQAAEGAIRMIKEKKLTNLKILDIGCGVGVIGLTIFSRLNSEAIVDEVVLSDINFFNLHSLDRTLKLNNFSDQIGKKIRYYLSDGLHHIPQTEKFDIIVCNPPHYFNKDNSDELLSPGKLGTYDENWSFHSSFYKLCDNFLTDNGEIWFMENTTASAADRFINFIESNPNLKFVEQFTEPLNPRFFWMISKKVS
jgi:methylase of polypeptide subunit release factors